MRVRPPPKKRIRPSRAKPKVSVVPETASAGPVRFVRMVQKDSTENGRWGAEVVQGT